ncbi:MAG TPA: type II secretion system F family protein [Acidobacteriota bacterium]|nr:type II secretion system F family protein [Acidobacteriota bacterium]
MAEFVCRYGTPAGEVLQHDYAADSEKALREQMEEQGYYVFAIQRKMDPLEVAKSLLAIRRKKVSDKQFVIFNQELASLIHSGLPLLRSLELLMERVDNPDFSAILQDVYRQVKSGTSLSEAFSSHPDVFPRVYNASILAGEKSGTLEQVIRRYLTYMKITLAIHTKVVSSMVYPFLLLCLSFGVISILIGYVIPKFSEFYAGFGNTLPLVTQILILVGNFVKTYWYLAVPLVVGLVLFFKITVQTSKALRRTVDRFKLRLPFLGNLWTRFSVSQLMRTLHTLLAGGIPLVNAIDVAAGAVGNNLISAELGQVSSRVKEGEPLWRSLDSTGLITHMAIEMIKVGEETGALEEMLKNIADFYDEEIDTSLGNILSIVEPVMLVIMGLIIATILLAMYYPLFTAISTIHE